MYLCIFIKLNKTATPQVAPQLPCPAGINPNRGSEETVRSQGVLWSANGIADGVGGALSVESISQTVRTNGHGIKTGVPPRKAGGRRGACE